MGSDEGSLAEEDWNKPEQDEVPKWTETDLPMTMETRTGGRKKTGMRYNRYGDDFLIDKIQPEELGEEMVSVGNLAADEEWQIINDSEHSWQEDQTSPEKEVDPEQSEIERRENRNLRILERMHGRRNLRILERTATDRPLDIPPDNLRTAPSTGSSIIIFFRERG